PGFRTIPEIAAERQAVRDAFTKAKEEDAEGEIKPETLDTLNSAVERLRAKFDQVVDKKRRDYPPMRGLLKAVAGLTRMLYNPEFDRALGELDKHKEVNIASLIGFMQAFNLRFGPASPGRQYEIYRQLYAVLAGVPNEILARAESDVRRVRSQQDGAD